MANELDELNHEALTNSKGGVVDFLNLLSRDKN